MSEVAPALGLHMANGVEAFEDHIFASKTLG